MDAGLQPALIAVQSHRIIAGVVFLALIPLGQLPALFAIPAGAGDALIGLTAIGAGAALRRGQTRVALTWNLPGLLDLIVAVGLGITTSPGSAHLFATTPTALAMSLQPLVLVPTFLVPLSAWLHIVSLRSLLGRASAADRAAGSYSDLVASPAAAN